MMFATLEDNLGEIEIVIFPNQYEQFKNLLFEGNMPAGLPCAALRPPIAAVPAGSV